MQKTKELLIFSLIFGLSAVALAQYTASPASNNPTVQPAPNTAVLNQNPANNPAPGNAATNAPAFNPNETRPTSTTLSLPAQAAAPRQDKITNEIRRRLQEKNATLSKAVAISREKNSIILEGEVPNAADRTMVEQTAKSAARRLKVVNELTVHE